VPIQKKWSRYSGENLKKLRGTTGAYEVADKNKKPMDIGKGESSGGVASRIRAKKKKHPAIRYFRVEEESFLESATEKEARHAAAHLKKYGKRPLINKRSPPDRSWS
jgi:hypothetical protein